MDWRCSVAFIASFGTFLWVLIAIIVDILFILITMSIAARKGHSPLLWGLLAVFLPLIALIIVLILPDRRMA